MADNDKALSVLKTIVGAIVKKPNDIKISVEKKDGSVDYVISTTEKIDRARLIGKGGNTIKAIRLIVFIVWIVGNEDTTDKMKVIVED